MNTGGGFEYSPDYSTTPGEFLLDALGSLGMSQAELARRTGLSVKHVNHVCQGISPLSADTAVLLERATGIDARMLVRLESMSQVEKGIQDETTRLERQLDWLKSFPVNELKKRQWISSSARGVEQLREILRFFRVAGPSAWEQVWATPTAYRLSQAFSPDMAALASWIRIGELKAEAMQLAAYDKEAFRSALPQIRDLTRVVDPADWLPRLEEICAKVGVAVVVEKEIKGARVNGIVRWLPSGNPLIMLSVRHGWADIFWFTFFHEAGHLIVHDRKRLTFVDSPSSRSSPGGGADATANRVIEQEADDFASRTLLSRELDPLINSARTRTDAQRIADEAGVHSGIVVGRMQHDRLVHFSQLNELRVRFKFEDS